MKNEEITAINLIEKILEFVTMVPDKNDWCLDKLKDNPPRYIRLKQIDILMDVYIPMSLFCCDLQSRIECIIRGQFLYDRTVDVYSEVYNKMEDTIKDFNPKYQHINTWLNRALQYNYEQIFRYLIELNKITNFNSGKLLVSHANYYSYLLIQQVNDSINTEKLISFLGTCVDPEDFTMPISDLMEIFDYPKEDLDKIDMEWL